MTMGTEKKRKQIVDSILAILEFATTENKIISRKKLEAEICIKYGVTKRKANEYIQLLIDAERVKDEKGELFYEQKL